MDISNLARELLDQLNSDILSHGWIAQEVRLYNEANGSTIHSVSSVLQDILSTGLVELCLASNTSGKVEFEAWRGTISDRIVRAELISKCMLGSDDEFSYWLCLTKNIDRFEI